MFNLSLERIKQVLGTHVSEDRLSSPSTNHRFERCESLTVKTDFLIERLLVFPSRDFASSPSSVDSRGYCSGQFYMKTHLQVPA